MINLLGGIFLGWSLGANDASNVIGPAVTSKMLKFRTAAIMASTFVVLGALLQGQGGIETLKGLTQFTMKQAVLCSVAAAITVTVMTLLGLPVSTSQAVIGAILGIGILNRQLNTGGLEKVFICWLGTPTGGLLIAVIFYRIFAAVYNRLRMNLFQSDALIRIALIIAGLYGAYALGANNVANVTAIFVSAGQLSIFTALLIGSMSICLGILTFSQRVMKTIGKKLVKLDPFSAVIVLLAEAVTVHIFAGIGVPVSSSQAVVGAVLGVGIIKGIRTVKNRMLLNILIGWSFTPIIATLTTFILHIVIHLKYVPQP